MTPSLSVTTSSSPRTDSHASARRSGTTTPATPLSTAGTLVENTGITGASDNFSTPQHLPLGCLLASVPQSLSLAHGDDWTEINASCLASDQSRQLEPTFGATKDEHHGSKTQAEMAGLAKKVDRLRSDLIRLLDAKWIRAEAARHVQQRPTNIVVIRLWILPNDVGRATVDRSSRKVQLALEHVVQLVNISTDVWHNVSIEGTEKFDPWACADESSLFYLFNTLPSPEPSTEKVENPYSKAAMQELLSLKPAGLQSTLYPFQARSAALMLQREASDELYLDPRLEMRRAPNGRMFYYCPRGMEFLNAPRYFSSQKSGVLAELMGSGKTVIALSLVLATKNHVPAIPPQYQKPLIRDRVGTLMEISAAAAGRHAIPWRNILAAHTSQTGEFLTACEQQLQKSPPGYEIPSNPIRLNRNTTPPPPPRKLKMCSTTIIVVPLNLLHQWCSELQKHIEEDALKVLIMDHNKKPLPPAEELAAYDIILFSRGRFEAEVRDGSDAQGRRHMGYKTPPVCNCRYVGSTRVRLCTCFQESDVYVSPLRHLHFLRIMIDEGHSFSSSNSNAVQVAQKLVLAERRWVISGTPARDQMLSVEVDLASTQSTTMEEDVQFLREAVLERRRRFDGEESLAAARTLGTLATYFLQVRPWSEGADWTEHVYRHEDPRKRTLSAFSQCMVKTLGQLLIKTQPADMERDIILPPLKHRVVRLKPSFFDKVTANLFVFVLTNNAVTSERTDVDYLFHPKSQGSRKRLITNLRLSNFFWSGWKETDIGGAVEIGCKYLMKDDVKCSPGDREKLAACIKFAEEFVLCSESWKAMSRTHDIGLFVDQWPENAATWALAKDPDELYGATLLHHAQTHVNSRLNGDPSEDLEAAGTAAVKSILAQSHDLDVPEGDKDKDLIQGMPASGIHAEVSIEKVRRGSILKSPKKSLQKSKSSGKLSANGKETAKTPVENGAGKVNKKPEPEIHPTPRKRPDTGIKLLSDSPLAHARIIGTVSAKLSYLLDQILEYCHDEKILVFYDGDNCAYYLAQCLDILNIKHEIYAKGISNEHRSKYIVAFAQDPSLRVLLMDVRLGALGLNANAASRVYFVNPVCRPNIEAQAAKRAHRIGQTKPVHVETLILSGTIEEAMFERSKAMTRNEHLEAKTLEDDVQITDIIQNAWLLPITPEEATGEERMAPLRVPQQIFDRPGRMAALGTPPKKRKTDVPDDAPQRKRASRTILGRPNFREVYDNIPPNSSIPTKESLASLSAPLAPAPPTTQMQTEIPTEEARDGVTDQRLTSLFGDGGRSSRHNGLA